MDKFRPLGNRILVERIPEETKTKGGIYIPEVNREKPQRGKVLAAGKGLVLEDGSLQPMELSAGDEILFGKYSGSDIKIDGKDLIIMREDDVLGVVTE